MAAKTADPSAIRSGSELTESVLDGSKTLTNVLQNLTTTLSQLPEASQAQTAALADLKEDLLLQDDADEPNPNRHAEPLDITHLTAVVNDCTHDSSAKDVVSDSRSDSESQSQNNIVESLTQALPNTGSTQHEKIPSY